MNTKTITYTAIDFANYHAGTMPEQQMYALEKAALEDPFLADALEGYANTNTAVADVAALQKAINKKKQNIFGLAFLTTKRAMQIAASIVIIGGAATFFLLQNNKKTQPTLADNTIAKPATIDTAFTKIEADNVATQTTTLQPLEKTATTIDTKTQEQFAVVEQSTKPVNTIATAPSALVEESIAKADDNVKRNNAFSDVYNPKSTPEKLYFQKGRVTDTNGVPIVGASVIIKNTKTGVATDKFGAFDIKTTDSVSTVTVASVGYGVRDMTLQSKVSNEVVLQNSNNNLQEVVVTSALSSKKKSASVGFATSKETNVLNGKVSGVQVNTNTTLKEEKLKGKKPVLLNNKILDTYFNNNIIPIFDENNKPINGVVTLQFDTDKKGKAQNIIVAKSLSSQCDAQAISLLKNAPFFNNTNQTNNAVNVVF